MRSLAELICVPPDRINEAWPHAKSLIQAACEATDLVRFEEIERALMLGEQHLWLAHSDRGIEAAATTWLYNGACVLTACSGHHRERWLPLFEKIEQYAKDEGCRTMRIFGRKGWERVLNGYRAEYVVLEKAL